MLLLLAACCCLLLLQTTQRRQFFEFLQGDAERILDQVGVAVRVGVYVYACVGRGRGGVLCGSVLTETLQGPVGQPHSCGENLGASILSWVAAASVVASRRVALTLLPAAPPFPASRVG